MIFRTLREGESESFVTHCTTVFTDAPPEFFRDHYLYDPNRSHDSMFVAEDEGRIVSSAQVFRREMYISGQPVVSVQSVMLLTSHLPLQERKSIR